MYLKGIFVRNSNKTEREAGNAQTYYGHDDARMGIEEWLAKYYKPDAPLYKRSKELADQYLEGGQKKILEIAAGSGALSAFFASIYPHHSYTVSELAIEQLQRFFPACAAFFNVKADIVLKEVEVENMSFADNTFDVVFIKAAVHHFENPYKGFTEIHRVLKPGGKVVFFNEPVSSGIPIVGFIQRFVFGAEEKRHGFNEHTYALKTYLSYGEPFGTLLWQYDPRYIAEIQKSSEHWGGIKAVLWKIIKHNRWLYQEFFIYQFGHGFVFEFTK